MRAAAVVTAMLILSACADDKLAANPPSGVDFSGQWKLNAADSDDPQHLAQAANGTAANGNNTQQTGGGRGRGRGGGVGGGVPGGSPGPVAPPIGLMGAALRWPGKGLEIKQVAGVVAFTSDGRNRVCQPGAAEKKHRHHDDDARDRDSMPSGRDAPPPVCGWSERTLVVLGGDTDDDRPAYEEDYSLSEDGMRLIEVVLFKNGRSNGFTLSRVWDRVPK
jgi:hypothetical protein